MPKHRIDNPVPTFYKVGDIVQMLTGPDEGMHGIVVVERNDNYTDNQVYRGPESIGVASMEEIEVNPLLLFINPGPKKTTETVIRWFDNPADLDMVSSSRC